MDMPVTKDRWRVETSHMVMLPEYFESSNLAELRRKLQRSTKKYRTDIDRPPLGTLEYRYEADKHDRVTVVHVSFIGFDGKRRRYARLRRD